MVGVGCDAQSVHSQLAARLARITPPEGFECEVDITGDKRWRDPKCRVDEFFNYGFDEETWRRYCYKRETIRRNMASYQEVPVRSNCATQLGRLLLREALRRDVLGRGEREGCFDDVPDAILEEIDIDPRVQQQCEELLLAHPDLERRGFAPPLPLQQQPQPHRHPRYRRD